MADKCEVFSEGTKIAASNTAIFGVFRENLIHVVVYYEFPGKKIKVVIPARN